MSYKYCILCTSERMNILDIRRFTKKNYYHYYYYYMSSNCANITGIQLTL